MKLLVLMLALQLLICAGTVQANSALSSQTVENWIRAQQALEHWGTQHRDKIAQFEEQGSATRHPMMITDEDILTPLKKSGLYHSAQEVVMKHGFRGLEEWANTSIIITKIAAAIGLDNQPQASDISELQTLLESPKISSQQKAKISEAIERNLAIMNQLKREISEADKNTVRPFLKNIRNLTAKP